MPSHGTSYSRTKAALVTRLAARDDLAGVNVSYQAPVKVPDVRGMTGSHESMWVDDAEGQLGTTILCGTPLVFDEEYLLRLVIQVLRPTNIGTQQAADRRVEELLYAVCAEIAEQQTWDLADLDLDEFEWWQVTPSTQEWRTGFLGGTPGHASAVEVGLAVRARRRFDG